MIISTMRVAILYSTYCYKFGLFAYNWFAEVFQVFHKHLLSFGYQVHILAGSQVRYAFAAFIKKLLRFFRTSTTVSACNTEQQNR